MLSDDELKKLKAEELLLEEIKAERQRKLPHLHGWKWYPWARTFFESVNKVNLLCAANQISKSSTQIRKCIHWATEPTLWQKLWASPDNFQFGKPQFWYLYPSSKVAEAELREKWAQFLPRDKDDAQYGWREVRKKGDLIGIEFNTGVMVYFKYYAQDVSDLQSGTVHAMFCDEELPFPYYEELIFRLSASSGYFHMVFTATLGQEEWRLAMECTEEEKKEGKEFLPDALKQCVSVFDCQVYEDGSPSHWTDEKIAEVIAKCATKAVELKRVWGRFVRAEGLRYPQFDVRKHYVKAHPLPSSWLIYAGVDIGSGGESGHPSAITFVAVRNDYRAARVFLGWRGDKIPTTAGSTLEMFIDMKTYNSSDVEVIRAMKAARTPRPLVVAGQAYDWGSADFGNIAVTMGEGAFIKANKTREAGFDLINTLFKNNMLAIYASPELAKLTTELSSLAAKVDKNKDKDDFTDSLRYCLMQIPFDFSHLVKSPEQIGEENIITDDEKYEAMNDKEKEIHDRRKHFGGGDEPDNGEYSIEDELAEWDSYL